MRFSSAFHHFWTIANIGSLFFTAAVYVGLLLYESNYTPSPCQSLIDAFSGDSVAAADVLKSNYFRYSELFFVLFQLALLMGYFTLHGVMAFYENPEEAHKFLVLSHEIFFGWLAFAFRVFGIRPTDQESLCTEVDVAPSAYWVIKASSMLFTPLIAIVALQVSVHVAIYIMEHNKKANPKVVNALNLFIKALEIVLGAFGGAMALCYGIWSYNPWVKAAIWTILAIILINVYVKFKWIPSWSAEAVVAHQQLQEETEMIHQFAQRDVEMQQSAKYGKVSGDLTPDNMTMSQSPYPQSAQLRNY